MALTALGCALLFGVNTAWLTAPLGRGRYLAYGLGLMLLKHNLDRWLAHNAFGRDWNVWSYWGRRPENPLALAQPDRDFYLSLLALAIPFALLGFALTLRRLRDAGLPAWLGIVFFVPFINVAFFLMLVLLPSDRGNAPPPGSWLERFAPRSGFGAATAGLAVAAALSIITALCIDSSLGAYAWGLFVGTPVAMGMASAMMFNVHTLRSMKATIGVALISLLFSALILFGLLVEGLICIAMAAPIAIPLVATGAMAGHMMMRLRIRYAETLLPALLLVPGLGMLESHRAAEQIEVRTVIEIAAPPDVVWRNVVSFSDLPPAREWYFKTGIAYPLRATISGTGVGAVRRCEFSTGAFVEPITAWEAPQRLAFGVTAQPPTMHELSLAQITPPHLGDKYIRSERGEFLLEALPGGRTRLTGTTWYELRFWPAAYWRLWSDAIIHRIHMRVLNHAKQLSEHP